MGLIIVNNSSSISDIKSGRPCDWLKAAKPWLTATGLNERTPWAGLSVRSWWAVELLPVQDLRREWARPAVVHKDLYLGEYGMELDPMHADTSIRRYERHSGENAVHVKTGQTFSEIAEERAARVPDGAADA
jgi:hypothetical protein